jgi:proline iminopeptidase
MYPETGPRAEYKFDVDSGHRLHVEEHGEPAGIPVIYLHGGPGGGIDRTCAQNFDPKKWRIILLDQRGAGRSTPHASLEDNTTWSLIGDLELVRHALGIAKWVVFGGSWGSTLALAYAQAHPEACLGLILRGIFLGRPQDITWLYHEMGAARIFPDAWDEFVALIPPDQRDNLVAAYYKRLTTCPSEERSKAAVAWSTWEGRICRLIPEEAAQSRFAESEFALAFSRIEAHYFFNRCFFPTENFLLDNMPKIAHLPGFIVHGRYDVVCPVDQAWALHKAWQGSQISIIPDAGHSLAEAGIRRKIIEITDSF